MIQIAASHSGTTNADFSRLAISDGTQRGIEQIDSNAIDGLANGNDGDLLFVARHNRIGGYNSCGLSLPKHVHELRRMVKLKAPGSGNVREQRFTCRQD